MKHANSIYVLLLIFLAGCASRKLKVRSTPPGADVYVSNQDRPATKVGQTPMELDPAAVPDLYSNSTQIQIMKDGFASQSVLVPNLQQFGGDGRINATLSATELPKACVAQEDSVNEIARGVAAVGGMIQRRKFSEANAVIDSLIAKYGGVSTLYDLQGNIYYLQKDVSRALASYKESNRLAPNNTQTLRMIDRLQKLQGPMGGGQSQ